MGPTALRLAEGGVIMGELPERRLQLLLPLSLPDLLPPDKDTLGAAVVLDPLALGPG